MNEIRIHETKINNLENIENLNDKELYEIGYNLLNDYGVTRDVEKARIYLEKSAKLGNKSANFLMGIIYLYEIGVEQDLDKALEYFTIAEDQEKIEIVEAKIKERDRNRITESPKVNLNSNNNNKSTLEEKNTTNTISSYKLYEIGSSLLGNGNPEDLEKAKMYLEKSAQLGNKSASFTLGSMYQNAIGVEQDLKEATKYYKQANASIQAQLVDEMLSEFGADYKYITDVDRTNKTIISIPKIVNDKVEQQLKEDNSNKQQSIIDNLDELYNMGSSLIGNGNPEDLEKAKMYLEKSAQLGNKSASFTLGSMYQNAIGVEQDLKEATKYYKQANASIQAQLVDEMLSEFGADYKYITDVDRTNKTIISIPKIVNDKVEQQLKEDNSNKQQSIIDNPNELYNMGSSLIGNGNPEDLEKAKMYLEKSAQLGNKSASFTLGSMYQNAIGVEQNLKEATKYFKQANASIQAQLVDEMLSEFGADYKYITDVDRTNKTIISIPKIVNDKVEQQLKEDNSNKQQSIIDNPDELYNMGSSLLGNGNPEDLEKARYYLERSATLGNKLASFKVGSIYQNALGVEQNLTLAVNNFKQAGAKYLVENLDGIINNFGNNYKYITSIDQSNKININIPQNILVDNNSSMMNTDESILQAENESLKLMKNQFKQMKKQTTSFYDNDNEDYIIESSRTR